MGDSIKPDSPQGATARIPEQQLRTSASTITFTSGPKRVAIVGCGPCGLTAVKQFTDEGHQVTCFDPNPEVGGIWYVDPNNKDRAAVYEGGYLTIDNKLMCFSDLQPEGPGVIYTFQQYQDYLVHYSHHFNLRKHIKLQHMVVQARKSGAGWAVTCRNVTNGQESTEHFDTLVLSTGSNAENKLPCELKDFKGEIIFSGHYVNNKPFAGKNVLLVGNGESAADMTKEISDVAANFTWSMRNYPAVIPRVPNAHHSTNMLTSRAHYGVQKKQCAADVMPGFSDSFLLKLILLSWSVMAYLYELIFYRLLGKTTESMGMASKRKVDPFGQELGKYIDANTPATPEAKELIDTWAYLGGNASSLQPCALMKNASFIPNVLNGKIKINVGGLTGSDGKSVMFKDGSKLDHLDAIVVCIGFKVQFPFLNKDDFQFCGDFKKLWKHSVYCEDPTLACVGFARPVSGGVPVIGEMTARMLARVFSGKCLLPKDLPAAAEKDRRFQQHALRHMPDLKTLVTSQIGIMDSMADLIGVQVKPWQLLFTDPYLLWRCYAWGFNPAQYRLFGPHANYDVARKACFEMDRGWNAFKTLLQSIDAVTPPFLPRCVGLHKWKYLSVDVERWSFGGAARYPENVLKMFVMAD